MLGGLLLTLPGIGLGKLCAKVCSDHRITQGELEGVVPLYVIQVGCALGCYFALRRGRYQAAGSTAWLLLLWLYAGIFMVLMPIIILIDPSDNGFFLILTWGGGLGVLMGPLLARKAALAMRATKKDPPQALPALKE